MKPILYTAPFAILAVFIGQSLDNDTAALAMGAIIGIMLAAVAILIWAIARDQRQQRDRASASQPSRAQAPAQAPYYIDATWRELPPTPHAPRPTPHVAIEAPTRAITIRRS